jgi:hypothetical protein
VGKISKVKSSWCGGSDPGRVAAFCGPDYVFGSTLIHKVLCWCSCQDERAHPLQHILKISGLSGVCTWQLWLELSNQLDCLCLPKHVSTGWEVMWAWCWWAEDSGFTPSGPVFTSQCCWAVMVTLTLANHLLLGTKEPWRANARDWPETIPDLENTRKPQSYRVSSLQVKAGQASVGKSWFESQSHPWWELSILKRSIFL